MKNVNQWPMGLQLLFAIPNAIVISILLRLWWPTNETEWKRYRMVAVPYLILAGVFYLLFGR